MGRRHKNGIKKDLLPLILPRVRGADLDDPESSLGGTPDGGKVKSSRCAKLKARGAKAYLVVRCSDAGRRRQSRWTFDEAASYRGWAGLP